MANLSPEKCAELQKQARHVGFLTTMAVLAPASPHVKSAAAQKSLLDNYDSQYEKRASAIEEMEQVLLDAQKSVKAA